MKLESLFVAELVSELHIALQEHLKAGRYPEAMELSERLTSITTRHVETCQKVLGLNRPPPLPITLSLEN